jgi:hypothetical protein
MENNRLLRKGREEEKNADRSEESYRLEWTSSIEGSDILSSLPFSFVNSKKGLRALPKKRGVAKRICSNS